MFLLQVRTKNDNGTWGEWLPHSAYATEQEVQEVCYTDVIDSQQWKYIKLSDQIQSGLTTRKTLDWRHASWESVMNPPIDPQLRVSFELREKLRVAQEVLAELERKTEGPL
jgi:hypothetical protein